jgi:hypothetical protein
MYYSIPPYQKTMNDPNDPDPLRPSLSAVQNARKRFDEVEPRSLFYRAATELVRLARKNEIDLDLAESLAVLLQTWNLTYYRFTRKLDAEHLSAIRALINSNQAYLSTLRDRKIASLHAEDADSVQRLFEDFARLLGPVGAAKSLHLLAPAFFPLWDNEIACRYRCRLSKPRNAKQYWSFMQKAKVQVEDLAAVGAEIPDPLKALDEYNYVQFTLPMLNRRREARAMMVDGQKETGEQKDGRT